MASLSGVLRMCGVQGRHLALGVPSQLGGSHRAVGGVGLAPIRLPSIGPDVLISVLSPLTWGRGRLSSLLRSGGGGGQSSSSNSY